MKTKLPDKPSELLELAINDAQALDRTLYYPDHQHWHNYYKEINQCAVCLAGAVMVNTLKVPYKTNIFCLEKKGKFNKDTQKKLYALECFRSYNLHEGFCDLNIEVPSQVTDELEKEYKTHIHDEFTTWDKFDLFVKDMKKIIKILKKHKL